MRILGRLRTLGTETASIAAVMGSFAAPGGGLASVLQDAEGMPPLPADPPIGGPGWTVLIPTLLLVGSFIGTYLLYRRFSRE